MIGLTRDCVDPRVYQSLVLASLLVWGQMRLDFGLEPGWIVATLGAALVTQWSCGRLYHRGRRAPGAGAAAARKAFDPWSALISGLSLCLLLRASHVAVMIGAAAFAIASKFLFRLNDRHVWNPTNLAIVVALVLDVGWVSPAQWGNTAYFGLLLAAAGSFVVQRAARADVTVAFLASWAALLFGRALWLGDPLAIPALQMRGGALLIFAFYMISDPKTTPRTRAGRIALAATIAVLAFIVQFVLHRQDGLFYAAAVCAPLAASCAWLRSRTSTITGDPRHASTPAPSTALLRLPSPGDFLPGAGLLRLLRGQGRQRAVQQKLARRTGA